MKERTKLKRNDNDKDDRVTIKDNGKDSKKMHK